MKTRTAATAAITLTALLALVGCTGTTGSGDGMPGMNHGSSDSPVIADANDADIMFAGMMIEHHAQAVEMSDLVLYKPDGIDERVISLAEEIKAAQQPEIEKMRDWLEGWGADASEMGGMDHGSGMMTDDDLRALEEATGANAARLFLEQMIEHHRGAVDMAQDEIDNGQNGEAVALAQAIIDAQTTEITIMEEILATL